MKSTNLLTVLFASVLLVGAVGCKKTPKNITTIPGGQQARPVGDGVGQPIRPNNGIGLGMPVDGAGLTVGNPGDIPEAPEDALEDRLPLAAQTVFFDFDRSAIRPSEQPKLAEVAEYLQGEPGVQLKIEGHCDERGTEEYNRALGERRAIAAREFLIQKHGIDSTRITTVSFGEDKPLSLEKTEEGYALNRRAEFVVLRAQ